MKQSENTDETMKYRGYFQAVNPKPAGNYILIFVSDWNKDFWAFYAYLSQNDWKSIIGKVNDLISRLNWRDGDVYVELIDYHDETMRKFYEHLYDLGHFSHWEALNPEQWERKCPRTST